MSTYLGPPILDAIPPGYLPLQMQNRFVGHLTAVGWQLLAQVDGDHSDLIPPATETIGTATFREVVRIYFPNNTTVTIGSYQACIADAFPQSIRLTALTAGAVQAGVTINGVTVLGAVGSAGSTANQNLQALYYALMDSVDATITGWTFDYNGSDTLICTNKAIGAMVTCSGNANVNYFAHAQSVLAGARSGFVNVDATYGYPVAADLTNGFNYFMDVWSRSFTLSTECLGGTTGPVFASYIDHADALTLTPPDGGLCTPIELLVGSIPSMVCRSTHQWAVCSNYGQKTIPSSESAVQLGAYDGTPEWHPFTGCGAPKSISDCGLAYGSFPGGPAYGDAFGVLELGIAGAGTVVETFKAFPTGCAAYALATPRQQSVRFSPAAPLPDLHVWGGPETNKVCTFSQVKPAPASYPTLAQALDATTAYTSILLSSTAELSPSGGSFIIGAEGFTYVGVSGGNTLTGVARGANGTTQARHFVGHVVYPATWFLKVNNGAICCGPTKPV